MVDFDKELTNSSDFRISEVWSTRDSALLSQMQRMSHYNESDLKARHAFINLWE